MKISQIKSLDLQNKLKLLEHSSQIEEKENYIVVKTLDNLAYHWGNFLIYKNGPIKGEYLKWICDFKNEFKDLQVTHMTFTWDIHEDNVDTKDFIDNGFEKSDAIILTSTKIKPQYINQTIECLNLETDADWKEALEFNILENSHGFNLTEYREFSENQFRTDYNLSKIGLVNYYIAKIDGKIVSLVKLSGDLKISLFESIVTAKSFRRQAIAQTLIDFAAKDKKSKTFILEADEDGPAINLYKTIGFEIKGKSYGLSFYKK